MRLALYFRQGRWRFGVTSQQRGVATRSFLRTDLSYMKQHADPLLSSQ